MIALGGALGGVFVGLVAPLVFDTYVELRLGLVAAGVLAVLAFGLPTGDTRDSLPRWARAAFACAVALLSIALVADSLSQGRNVVAIDRNFHGVLRVLDVDTGDELWHRKVMMCGGTDHGYQFHDPARSGLPVAYYGRSSGAGVALAHLDRGGGRRVGLVGLGAGILASYGQPEDMFRFYELNPAVTRFARQHFTYLGDSRAAVDVLDGDGRLLLSREASGSFDLLIIDAFSSDSIPVHLLTEEAFAVYERLLADGGVVALHLTNRYMDLVPVATRSAHTWTSSPAVFVLRSPRDDRVGAYSATYVVLSGDEAVSRALVAAGAVPAAPQESVSLAWTDDFSNPLEALRWR
jgi:hypothetical protein